MGASFMVYTVANRKCCTFSGGKVKPDALLYTECTAVWNNTSKCSQTLT